MEEFFAHKCVTADALPPAAAAERAAQSSGLSTWTQRARCELVIVQENQQACGASRAVLAAIVGLTLQSRKTSAVLLFTHDALQLADSARASEKLVHIDYSSDVSLLRAALLGSEHEPLPHNGQAPPPQPAAAANTRLLTKLQSDINARLSATSGSRQSDAAARPVVVILDSLNAVLAHHSLRELLLFLRQLRETPRVGSIVVRLSASTVPPAVQHALASESTAVALVETPASLSAYPILAKERRREVPKDMHGLVLLLRHKKNGRSSESVDYFQVQGDRMQFFPAAQMSEWNQPTAAIVSSDTNTCTSNSIASASTSAITVQSRTVTPASASHVTPALPVRQEDVSFNLSISVEEQLAKSRVQLPYMHQGQSAAPSASSSSSASMQSSSAASNLFFIDDDDPDWDDDDLDDDLDI